MSEQQEFKPGDVVQLRSGGPAMTVDGISEIGEIICVWFEGSKKNKDMYSSASLKRYEPPRTTTATFSRA